MAQEVRQGVYNVDYYSGAQVALYIGDVWVDDVSSLSYTFQQNRTPIYDYANPLYRDVSKGPVLVQGQFTINFKEAGYLWLILDRYRSIMKGAPSLLTQKKGFAHKPISGIRRNNNPFGLQDDIVRQNIEQVVNGEFDAFTRNEVFQDVARAIQLEDANRQLTGYASVSRSNSDVGRSVDGTTSVGRSFNGRISAESVMETFENLVWRLEDQALDNLHRRPDDPELNPFDMYIVYGDFAGDDDVNHTIRKLQHVNIIGGGQQVVIDGQPIQEAYSFIARNIV